MQIKAENDYLLVSFNKGDWQGGFAKSLMSVMKFKGARYNGDSKCWKVLDTLSVRESITKEIKKHDNGVYGFTPFELMEADEDIQKTFDMFLI